MENKLGSFNGLITKFFKCAADTQTRCTLVNQQDAHTTMRRANTCIRTGKDGKNAAIYSIGDPQFGTVEDVFITVALGSHGNGLYIAARVGLGDTDSSPFLTLSHNRQETLALLLGAKCRDHVRNEYMRINDTFHAHPTTRKLFNNL